MMKSGPWPVSEMRLAAVALSLAAVYAVVTSAVVGWAAPLLAERVKALVGEATGASVVVVGIVAAVLAVSICAGRRS